jgi:hypothetical protein
MKYLQTALDFFLKGYHSDENKFANERLFTEGSLHDRFFSKRVAIRNNKQKQVVTFGCAADFNNFITNKILSLGINEYPKMNLGVNKDRFNDLVDSTDLKKMQYMKSRNASELTDITLNDPMLLKHTEHDFTTAIVALVHKYDTFRSEYFKDGDPTLNSIMVSLEPSIKERAQQNTHNASDMDLDPAVVEAPRGVTSLGDAFEFVNRFGINIAKEVFFRVVHYEVIVLELYSYSYRVLDLEKIGEKLAGDIDYCVKLGKSRKKEIGLFKDSANKKNKFIYYNFNKERGLETLDKYEIKARVQHYDFAPCLEVTKDEKNYKTERMGKFLKSKYADVDWIRACELVDEACLFRMFNLSQKKDFFVQRFLDFELTLNSLVNFDVDQYWQRKIYDQVEKKFIGFNFSPLKVTFFKLCFYVFFYSEESYVLNTSITPNDIKEWFEKLSRLHLIHIYDSIKYDVLHLLTPGMNAFTIFENNSNKYHFICMMYSNALIEAGFVKFCNKFKSLQSLIEDLQGRTDPEDRQLIIVYLDYNYHGYLRDQRYFNKEIEIDYFTSTLNFAYLTGYN